jgi:hypothetical protein
MMINDRRAKMSTGKSSIHANKKSRLSTSIWARRLATSRSPGISRKLGQGEFKNKIWFRSPRLTLNPPRSQIELRLAILRTTYGNGLQCNVSNSSLTETNMYVLTHLTSSRFCYRVHIICCIIFRTIIKMAKKQNRSWRKPDTVFGRACVRSCSFRAGRDMVENLDAGLATWRNLRRSRWLITVMCVRA